MTVLFLPVFLAVGAIKWIYSREVVEFDTLTDISVVFAWEKRGPRAVSTAVELVVGQKKVVEHPLSLFDVLNVGWTRL